MADAMILILTDIVVLVLVSPLLLLDIIFILLQSEDLLICKLCI